MFWNDPILYGATLPYRDVPVQTPFFGQMFPQQNIPRFIPPMHGFVPPMYHHLYNLHQFQVPQMPQMPQVPQMGFNPFTQPFAQPFTQPFAQQFAQPFELNQPFYGWNRPLTNIW